jgi:hypothetical protein
MVFLEGSGVPVLYIGRTVPKGPATKERQGSTRIRVALIFCSLQG